MFDRFGEMNSAEEINELAENLMNEGDIESLFVMAKENGLEEFAEMYRDGETPFLCDAESAAIGKLEMEEKKLKPKFLMADWCDYIKSQVMESPQMAVDVRKTGKSLKGCIAKLMIWSFKNKQPVDKDIAELAGIKCRVEFGIPGMAEAKKIIREYYEAES